MPEVEFFSSVEYASFQPALARELGAKGGDTLLVRVEQPSPIPREYIQGRREEISRTIRFRVGAAVVAPHPSEFSPRPNQGDVRALFVQLGRLQKELGLEGKANFLVLAGGKDADSYRRRVQERFTLEGARRHLAARRKEKAPKPAQASLFPPAGGLAEKIRAELDEILKLLEGDGTG